MGNGNDRFWAKVLFREFIRHFRKLNDDEIVVDIKSSMDDLEDLNDSGISFGSKMVRWSMERTEEPRAKASRENGVKGGRPKKSVERNEVKVPAEPKKPSEPKKVIDDGRGFVTVTDKEYKDLVNAYGRDLEDMVRILSNYKESSGKKYKSDAAALRCWVHDKLMEDKSRAAKNQQQKSFAQIERDRQAEFVGSLLSDEVKREYGIGGY